MIPDWQMMIHPLELCGVLALAGSCLLYVFVLHMKMRTLARIGRQQREELEGRVAQITEAAERLRLQLAEMERPAIPAQPLNLTKRGQILRMRRRGERPETIAGALAIPRNEVDLLIKVHDLALEHVEKGAMPALARK
ncbi:MAG: hypothetical protein LAP39_28810 [Acidobacteriia bacterium]|nr:hypothetical protein [Terriglobia bacterium]